MRKSRKNVASSIVIRCFCKRFAKTPKSDGSHVASMSLSNLSELEIFRGHREDRHLVVRCYCSLKDQVVIDPTRLHLDHVTLSFISMDPYQRVVDCLIGMGVASVYMTPCAEPRDVCSFEHVNVYSQWLRYGTRKVRYLSERVFRMFGYTQTVPRSPYESASF
ncbi:hypothetical protein MTR_5g067070 [Medicago truncatula]|uniref:Uncharacterized protein n=1 Tax=Medicago truncatula TaxID=3880 RepID=G7K5Z5_MEDTR|nr:hypothetical protein MTR_5g067070 [Medicago truncatula]